MRARKNVRKSLTLHYRTHISHLKPMTQKFNHLLIPQNPQGTPYRYLEFSLKKYSSSVNSCGFCGKPPASAPFRQSCMWVDCEYSVDKTLCIVNGNLCIHRCAQLKNIYALNVHSVSDLNHRLSTGRNPTFKSASDSDESYWSTQSPGYRWSLAPPFEPQPYAPRA